MRSLADQSTEELGGRWSVLVRQKQDHVRLERLLQELTHNSGAEQDEVLNRVNRLVFTHAFAEESVLWPAIRRALPDGDALTVQVEREHQEINESVARLEATSSDDPGRPALVERTIELLRADVRDEEDVVLPRLQEAVDTGTLRRLGVEWELVRCTAPTRPHPLVARRPPGNVLAALPLSALDRTRDVLDRAGRRLPGRAAPVLAAASRSLGAAAHLLERVPAFGRGERPETHRSAEASAQ
jgi:hypothetical protein